MYPWLVQASFYSFCLPLLTGVLLINKRSSLLYRLLLLYIVFIALVEVTAKVTISLKTTNNVWIDHIYTPTECLIVAAVYYSHFTNPLLKRGTVVAACGVVVFSGAYVLWGESVMEMNSLPRMLNGVVLIAMAVAYFYQVANDLSQTYLDRDPMFILSCGIIVYQAGTAVAFSMFNKALAASYDTARICISVILVLNILYRVVLMLALKRTAAT